MSLVARDEYSRRHSHLISLQLFIIVYSIKTSNLYGGTEDIIARPNDKMGW